jgi:hypothetical protein
METNMNAWLFIIFAVAILGNSKVAAGNNQHARRELAADIPGNCIDLSCKFREPTLFAFVLLFFVFFFFNLSLAHSNFPSYYACLPGVLRTMDVKIHGELETIVSRIENY